MQCKTYCQGFLSYMASLASSGAFTEILMICLVTQDPDEHMRLQGSTGTDSRHQFVDDGLEHKYEDLHASAVSLAADFSRMEELLRAAKAERFLYLRKPAIPVGAYRRSSR